MNLKRWIINTAVMLTGVLLVCFILEWVSRVLFYDKIVLFPRYHSEAQYGDFHIRRLRPNTVFWHSSQDGTWRFETNNQGFRNKRNFEYTKPDTVLRIICLGDSHTEGFEVRQDRTFSEVLERELRAVGVPAEVYNMGVSGYGTDEELILFENEVVKYRPDIVVMAFFANDYEDNLKTGLFTVQDTSLINTAKENLPGVRILDFINSFYVIRKLSENSYLYSFVFNSIWDLAKSARIQKAREGAREADTSRAYAIAESKIRTPRELILATKLLNRFFDSAKSYGIPILFVDIPQHDMTGSLDASMRSFVEGKVDSYVDGKLLVDPYKLHMDTHAPHGHRHISELTHMMIGLELAKHVMNKYRSHFALNQTYQEMD